MTKNNPGSAATGDAGSSSGILKFILGVILGALMAFGYVRFDLALPKYFDLPEKLRGNLVSSAAEFDLYDLARPLDLRRRALEVYFQNRAEHAVGIDAEFGHPFLEALYRKRTIREARQLRLQWAAFDKALAKPALRQALAREHGTDETIRLKQAMLMEGLKRKPFLAQWIMRGDNPATAQTLLATLKRLGRHP